MALLCVLDARRRRIPMAGIAGPAIFFFWPIAIPIYLVWSRGWKRGLLAALAFLTAVAVLYLGALFATEYAVWA